MPSILIQADKSDDNNNGGLLAEAAGDDKRSLKDILNQMQDVMNEELSNAIDNVRATLAQDPVEIAGADPVGTASEGTSSSLNESSLDSSQPSGSSLYTYPSSYNYTKNNFQWIPRCELAKGSLDAIVTYKKDLLDIRGPIVKMNENDSQTPQIVVSNFPLLNGKCYYWELKISFTEDGSDEELFGDLIEIGVLNVERSSWELENISDQQFGWCLFGDGCIAHNDDETFYLKKGLEHGDRVGVLCNLKHDCPGFLAFYINGVSCGLAFSNITGPVHAAVSLVQPSVEIEVTKFEIRD